MLNYALCYLLFTGLLAYNFWIAIDRSRLQRANDKKVLRALICLGVGLGWPLGPLWIVAHAIIAVLNHGCDKLFDLIVKLLD